MHENHKTSMQGARFVVLMHIVAWGRHKGACVDVGGMGGCMRAKDVHNKHKTSTRCARFVFVVHVRVRGRAGVEEGPGRSSEATRGTCARRRRACVYAGLARARCSYCL
jgi:hypothetical protein